MDSKLRLLSISNYYFVCIFFKIISPSPNSISTLYPLGICMCIVSSLSISTLGGNAGITVIVSV